MLLALLPLCAQGQLLGEVRPLQAQVEQYEPFFVEIDVQVEAQDPYDPEEVRLDMLIRSPEGQALRIPCFWHEAKDGTPWEGRFTPRQAGTYAYSLELRYRGQVEQSQAFHFTATPGRGDGFLRLQGYSQLVFDSGRPFRGLGMNFGWERRPAYDRNPNLTYEHLFEEFEAHGMNYTRTWMCPWNLPLEWQRVATYGRYEDNRSGRRFHPGAVARMEEMLAQAKLRGVYVQLVLDYHGALTTRPDFWGGNNYWTQHAYHVQQGGPASEPADFFSMEEARTRYKARLRYLVARWGYHPQLVSWEFFNEVDNAMESEGIPPSLIVDWHADMADYLRSLDPYGRAISTSLSHRGLEGLFELPGIDFTQTHPYGRTRALGHITADMIAQYQKPYVASEFAHSYTGPQAGERELYVRDLHKGLWRGMHTPTPVLPLTWWWERYEGWDEYQPFARAAGYLQRMQRKEGALHAVHFRQRPDTGKLEVLGMESEGEFFLWVDNLRDQSVRGESLVIEGLEEAPYQLILYPTDGSCLRSTAVQPDPQGRLRIKLPPLEAGGDVALILSQDAAETFGEPCQASMRVFPVPAQNLLKVESETEMVLLEIANVLGQALRSTYVAGQEAEIDLSGLRAGVYVLLIHTRSGLQRRKFVKQ